MLLIVGTLRLPPDRLPHALATMERMILASRAEEGCQEYSYAEDILEPGLIHVKEVWQSRKALDGHFASAHLGAWRADWQTFGIFDRNLRLYEVGDAIRT